MLLWTEKLTGFHMTPKNIEIGHLSREEKLRVMEAIWEDLSRDAKQVESPDWHREALDETDRRRGSGQESVVDWHKVKKDLRKRFE
jgi:hypothetical protein